MTNDKMTDCGYVSSRSPALSGANASWDPDFVPEGLNDRSQAIYCLGKIQTGVRPVGNGMIGVPGLFITPDRITPLIDPTRPSLRDWIPILHASRHFMPSY